jgi:predicted SAM-dependent methyltransferase
MKLHLGCWQRRLPGWIGVDIRPDAEPDVVADIRLLDLWASDEVEAIYACHVLEHIPRPDLLRTLREWRRILAPGGLLRVAVPDFEALAGLYLVDQVPLWRLIGPLCGRQNYAENTHYVAFDYQYLAWMLTEAGFHTIHRWQPEDWQPAGYDDYSRAVIDGVPISLNVGAYA